MHDDDDPSGTPRGENLKVPDYFCPRHKSEKIRCTSFLDEPLRLPVIQAPPALMWLILVIETLEADAKPEGGVKLLRCATQQVLLVTY